MAWTGRIGGGDFTGFEELAGAGGEGSQGGSLGTDGNGAAGRRYVAVEREGKVSRIPAEDFLVHVLAAQIPADFGPETLKDVYKRQVWSRSSGIVKKVYGNIRACGRISPALSASGRIWITPM